jgi:hypothetical protein
MIVTYNQKPNGSAFEHNDNAIAKFDAALSE